MRYLILLCALLLVSACGNSVPTEGNWPAGTWPARVVSMNGFSAQQEQQVTAAITYLNQQAGVTLVNTTDTGSGYPITIQYVDSFGANAQDQAGEATVTWQGCLVQLRDLLFGQDANVQRIAQLHEFGHCAGIRFAGNLIHDPNPEAIMNAVVRAFPLYSPTDISSFVSLMGRAVGLM